MDLNSTAHQWKLGAQRADVIRGSAPAGWKVRVVSAPTTSDGDGGAPPSEEALDAIRDAEVYFGFGISRPLFLGAKRLKWVHSGAAGVGGALFPEMQESNVVLTNSAGVHAVPIAEHVLAGVLCLLRGLDIAVEQQRERKWSREPFVDSSSPVRELRDCRAVVVGSGGIGSAIATRLTALGVLCTGIRRRPELGVPDGFSEVAGPDALDSLLPHADLLILAVPATQDTREMIMAARLDLLPPGAIVVNIARGSLLDERALAERIEQGRLRGAVLDVFQEEPLPASSPLWQMRQVVLTPHVSPVSPHGFWPRALDLFLTNWRRYVAGQPLLNVVDKAAGY